MDAIARLRESMGLAATSNGQAAQKDPQDGLQFKASKDEDDSDEEPASTLESREAAASSNWQKLQQEQQDKTRKEERRAKLIKDRESAQRFAKLQGAGLGEDESNDGSTLDWLKGSKKRARAIEKQREDEHRQNDAAKKNQAGYTDRDLAGVKVAHELGDIEEGQDQILTFKDRTVDDDDEEDELENADLRAQERLQERLDAKKKKKVYDPMQEATGESSILGHYDEEIDGKKKKRFTLGDTEGLLKQLENGSSASRGQRYSLFDEDDDLEMAPANDYQEIKVKKSKKKKDKSKSKKASFEDEAEPAPGPMELDVPVQTAPRKRQMAHSFVDDDDLQASLAVSRRAALKRRKIARPEDLARQLKQETPQEDEPEVKEEPDADDGLYIDNTNDFVKHIENVATSGPRTAPPTERASGTPDIKDESDHDEQGDTNMERSEPEDGEVGYIEHEPGTAAQHDVTATGLDDEDTVDQGIGGAMKLLRGRGLLETHATAAVNKEYRERQRFLLDKQRREDEADRRARTQREHDRASGRLDRLSTRDRDAYAATQNSRREQHESRQMAEAFNREYQPSVHLQYTDEFGRSIDRHEAFKQLSHQFHGKGSGAMKTTKRLEKIQKEKDKEAQTLVGSGGRTEAGGHAAKASRQAGVRLQ